MSFSLNDNPLPFTIDFNEIPPAGDLLVPGDYVEIAADYSNVGLLTFPTRLLAIGQMIGSGMGAGSATPGQIYQIFRNDQGVALFGAGSMLADLVDYILASNPALPLDAVGMLPASGGTAATGTITFSGAATIAAQQAIGVAGFRITWTVQPTDSPTNMAADFIAAAQGLFDARDLPVSFSAAAGVVTVTAAWHGLSGNEIDIRINPARADQTVPGVDIAIVGMSGGAGVPSIASIISEIGTTWYTDIGIGFTDPTSLAAIQTALLERYTAMQNVDSTCYATWIGSQGTLASDIDGINCQFLVVMGVTNPQDPSWRWTGALTGVAAAAFNADPARQLRGLVLPNIIAPAPNAQMQEPEQQALLAEGISTFEVSPSNQVLIQRLVSTYTLSNLDVPDAAWQDIMTAKTMTRIRFDWKNFLKLVAPRAKLSDDGSLASQYDASIMTPGRLAGLWAGRCQLYEKAGWIENSAASAQQSVFQRDPNDRNRVNSQLVVTVIGNDMVNACQLLFVAA